MFNTISRHINKWARVRTTDFALNFLTSGYGFEVLRADYQRLKSCNTDNLYVYLGISDFDLIFYIIPNTFDNMTVDDPIVTCYFTRDADGMAVTNIPNTTFSCFSGSGANRNQIQPEVAMQRVLNWFVHSHKWYKKHTQKDIQDIVKYFVVPKVDFDELFAEDDVIKVLLFLAINPNENATNEIHKNFIELILCNETEADSSNSNSGRLFADVSIPIPPFSA